MKIIVLIIALILVVAVFATLVLTGFIALGIGGYKVTVEGYVDKPIIEPFSWSVTASVTSIEEDTLLFSSAEGILGLEKKQTLVEISGDGLSGSSMFEGGGDYIIVLRHVPENAGGYQATVYVYEVSFILHPWFQTSKELKTQTSLSFTVP